jgi:thiosulfate dehydrogenase [quinone] large subunit
VEESREVNMQNGNREVAYALLRATLGLVFLFYGLGKLHYGLDAFVLGLTTRFTSTLLPTVLVVPFGYILPFAELVTGILLILGAFNRFALLSAGLLLAALTTGAVIEPSPGTVADNIGFALVVFLLLWTAERNHYSLDHLIKR